MSNDQYFYYIMPLHKSISKNGKRPFLYGNSGLYFRTFHQSMQDQ